MESNSPVIDLSAYNGYIEVLHEKVMDIDVKNIGIIATYGAGKSSLLKTYDAYYPKEKKITILLANFYTYERVEVDGGQTTNNNSNNNSQLDEKPNVKDIECEVEKSILEQFLFSESKMLNSQNF